MNGLYWVEVSVLGEFVAFLCSLLLTSNNSLLLVDGTTVVFHWSLFTMMTMSLIIFDML